MRGLLDLIYGTKMRRWVSTTLAAIMAFSTTYALILPAITLENETARETAGIVMESGSRESETLSETVSETVSAEEAEGDRVSFDSRLDDGEHTLTVHVEADADAFPEGTTMEASVVEDQDVIDSITESAEGDVVAVRAVDLTFTDEDGETVQPAEGSQVSVVLSAGEKEPADLREEERLEEEASAGQDTETTVVQYTEDNGVLPVETNEEISFQVEPENDLDQESAVSFEIGGQTGDRETQTYAIVETIAEDEEQENEVAAQTEGEQETIPEVEDDPLETVPAASGAVETDPEAGLTEPAGIPPEESIVEPEESILTVQDESCLVTLMYGPEAEIPQGASLKVEEILREEKSYVDHLVESKKVLNEAAQNEAKEEGIYADPGAEGLQFFSVRSLMDESDACDRFQSEADSASGSEIVYARFFDITILNADGEAVMPAAPVKVCIELLDAEQDEQVIQTADTAQVIHFGEEKTEVMEAEVIEDTIAGVTFDAEGFSVYGVVYTVDFAYSVNGQMYQFSFPGGGFVSLTDLVEMLGILGDTNSDENGAEIEEQITDGMLDVEASDAAKKFVANVASVEFSTPGLVDVSKVENETTVGQIKEKRGLECQYSAELTEEQIAEMNAQTAEAGDWALISMRPFTSEELLTVTMTNGDQFVVRVTDAQISTHVITADGKDYIITVTYGPEAGIPDGAILEAEEIDGSTSEWDEYYSQAANAIGRGSLAFARFFDIKIMVDGEEIEPQAPVETKIEYDSCIPLDPDSNPKAVHFAKDGMEVLNVDMDDDEFASKFTFEQGSFSVVGTVVSELADGQYLIYGYDVNHNGTHYTDKSYTNHADWAYKNVTAFTANYYALQYYNGLSVTQLDTNNTANGRAYYTGNSNTRILWTVTKSGDGYLIANGSRYLRDNNGTLTTATSADQATVWTYQNGQLSDGNRYLVYNRSSSRFSLSTTQPVGTNIYFAWNNPSTTGNVTIHYMLDNGDGTYSQSSQTTLALQSNSINLGSQYDLRQGIPSGMQYEKTYVSDVNDAEEFSGLGTEIHYFLQTNYGLTADYINSRTYRGWLYRETTSWDFDYGVNGWPSNGGVAVTTVSAYRSFGDEKDIYVVYREAPPASTPASEDVDAEAPKISKDKIDNEDGTYDLDLSVTGSANSSQSTTRANVVVVLDLSYSMLGQDTGVSGQSRLDACKAAIQSLASQLFSLNENAPGTIEAAYIGFAQRVLNEREINSTYTELDSFMAAVNKSTTAAGTNWDAALEAVNNIQWSDGDPVYVIFVTDGQPNSYSNTASPTNGNNSYWDSGNYNILSSAGTAGNAAVTAARTQVTALKNAGVTVYGIGAFINSATDAYFVDQINIDSDKHFKSNNTAALNNNITKIVSDISSSVGYENVQVTDGITALTSTALVNGTAENFRYEVAKYNFDSEGNRTTKIEGTEAAVTKNNDGTLTIAFPDGTTDTINQASYAERNKQVTWNMGNDYQLRDGYSYDVKFTVWPSQEAYDLIADLNNGVSSWVEIDEETGAAKIVYGNDVPDHILPESGKREYGTEYTKQIVRSGNSYSLKTNLDSGNVVTYTKVKTVTENGVTTTTRENGQSEFRNPDPMPLNHQLLPLVKKWDDATDSGQRPGSVSLDLHRTTPKTSSAASTDIVYLEQLDLSGDHVNTDGDWTYYNDNAVTDKEKISIAPGLMVSEDIDRFSSSYQRFTYNGEIYALLDTGHDYYFVENPMDYHFELTDDTYHPMLINGVLWNVAFSYDDAGNITDVELIDTMSEISATNTLKGRLYVTKEVEIPEGAIGYDLKTTTFPITITLKDKDGNAIVGEGPATNEDPNRNGVMYRIQYGRNHPSNDEGWQEWSETYQNCGRSSQKTFTAGTITENIYAGDTIYVGNLPAGAVYEVTEGTLSSGWKLVSITYGDETKKIAGNDEDQVTVKNTLPSFQVGILKTRQDGTTALEGAKFDLYGSDYYTVDASGASVVNGEAAALKTGLTSGTDGKFDLGFLAGGTYYLVETSAPDGYIQLDNPVIITVDGTSAEKKGDDPLYVTYEQSGQTISISKEGVTITTEPDDDDNLTYIYQLTVVNNEGVELPNAGGPGTRSFAILGGVLILGAGVLLWRKRRLV